MSSALVNGLAKDIYDKSGVISTLYQQNKHFHQYFSLKNPKHDLGRKYIISVELTHATGITAAVNNGINTLNSSNNPDVEQAEIDAGTIWLPQQVADDVFMRIKDAAGKGPTAFADASKFTMGRMVNSAAHYAEIMMRWGCGTAANDAAGAFDNLGEIESATRVGTTDQYKIVIKDGHWNSLTWIGMENQALDIRASSTGSARCANNPTIDSVNFKNRELTVTGTHTGQLENVAEFDHIFWGGDQSSNYEKECLGFARICGHESGDLFGIDSSSRSNWRGYQHSVGNQPLTFGDFLQVANRMAIRGYHGKSVAMVPVESWTDVARDAIQALNVPEGKKGEYSVGASKLTVRTAAGDMDLVQDPYGKRGFAMVSPLTHVCRVGANEGTFDPLGTGEVFYQHPDKTCLYARYAKNFGIYSERPDLCTLVTDIQPGSDPIG